MARPKEMDIRKIFSTSQDQADRLEDFRFRHRYASESAALREALDEGMKVIDQRAAKGEKAGGK